MELDPEIAAALRVVGDRLIQSNLDTMDGLVMMRNEVNRIGELFNATLDRGGVTTESRVIPGSPDCPHLTIRIHRPEKVARGPMPCLFHAHGGGMVAGSAAVMARDLGGTKLCFQWLITPQLDDRNDTPSAHGDWIGWPRRLNVGAWKAVLGERYGTDRVTGHDSAPRANDLSGLPPWLSVVCAGRACGQVGGRSAR